MLVFGSELLLAATVIGLACGAPSLAQPPALEFEVAAIKLIQEARFPCTP